MSEIPNLVPVEPEVPMLEPTQDDEPLLQEDQYNPIETVESIKAEYGRPLIKEDFMDDKRLQDLVIANLESRMRDQGLASAAYGTASKIAGASTVDPRNYRNMPFEETFEIWQNYQRSFAGGQTVTTANELAYGLQSDKKTLANLGAGYVLFDSMDNAITGAGSWREMGDAIWDYGKAAIWDPTTVVSFGVGKALTASSAKTASHGLKLTAKAAAKKLAAEGVSQQAKKSVTSKALKGAAFIAPDFIAAVGADVAYQNQKIMAGVQDKYQGVQTGTVALGTMALPLLFGTSALVGKARHSKALQNTIAGYKKLDARLIDLNPDEAFKEVTRHINTKQIADTVDDTFGELNFNQEWIDDWVKYRDEAKSFVRNDTSSFTDADAINVFSDLFWFGAPDGSKKGYAQALQEAGFFPHESMLRNKNGKVLKGETTRVFTQTIKFMSDETVERLVKNFEEATGRKLGIVPSDEGWADGLMKFMTNQSSTAGQTLATYSKLARFSKGGELSGIKGIEAAAGLVDESIPKPKRLEFALSIYKRLLTSHLSTTGANLKGFAQLVSLNTAADFVSSAVYLGQSAWHKTLGNADEALVYANKAYGSFFSPVSKAADIFSPHLTVEQADLVMQLNPQVIPRIFRDVSGDSGVLDSYTHFNLGDKANVFKAVDKYTAGVQILTGVRVQDELTKRWTFGANTNVHIMKEYGMSPSRFYQRDDLLKEMSTPKWKNVLDKAVQDTLRETASVNWSTLPARNSWDSMRGWAKAIEGVTNRGPLGFFVPFGSFLNTTIATMGDLTMVNALRHVYKQSTGVALDYADDEFARLVGKGAIGWGAIALGVPLAQEKIKMGLAWNQEDESLFDYYNPIEGRDGELKDREYDWPMSTITLMSQIVAHSLDGKKLEDAEPSDFKVEKVPTDLWIELGDQLGGQAIRDVQDLKDTVAKEIFNASVDGEWSKAALTLLTGFGARIAQGTTRHLEPFNVIAGFAKGDTRRIDLNQGAKTWNQATRYVDNLFNIDNLLGHDEIDSRYDPTKATMQKVTVGKQLLGTRTGTDTSIADQVFNSAGYPTWDTVSWNGPEEVKNYMDSIIGPIMQQEAIRLLTLNKNYFEMRQEQKIDLLKTLMKRAREKALQQLKESPSYMGQTYNAARKVSLENTEKRQQVLEALGYDSLEEVLERPDALLELQKIDKYIEHYEDLFPTNVVK